MTMMFRKNSLGNASRISAGVASVLAASALMGASPVVVADESVVFYACKSKRLGTIRIVHEGTSCTRWETQISWNQEGVQGETGPAGPQGAQGPAGPEGPQGPSRRDGTQRKHHLEWSAYAN